MFALEEEGEERRAKIPSYSARTRTEEEEEAREELSSVDAKR